MWGISPDTHLSRPFPHNVYKSSMGSCPGLHVWCLGGYEEVKLLCSMWRWHYCPRVTHSASVKCWRHDNHWTDRMPERWCSRTPMGCLGEQQNTTIACMWQQFQNAEIKLMQTITPMNIAVTLALILGGRDGAASLNFLRPWWSWVLGSTIVTSGKQRSFQQWGLIRVHGWRLDTELTCGLSLIPHLNTCSSIYLLPSREAMGWEESSASSPLWQWSTEMRKAGLWRGGGREGRRSQGEAWS